MFEDWALLAYQLNAYFNVLFMILATRWVFLMLSIAYYFALDGNDRMMWITSNLTQNASIADVHFLAANVCVLLPIISAFCKKRDIAGWLSLWRWRITLTLLLLQSLSSQRWYIKSGVWPWLAALNRLTVLPAFLMQNLWHSQRGTFAPSAFVGLQLGAKDGMYFCLFWCSALSLSWVSEWVVISTCLVIMFKMYHV
jgi:hypothetical protein